MQAKYVLLLVVVAAIAVAVPIAQGTTAAKDPRVTKLTKQVNALTKQVKALKTQVGSLGEDVSSLKSDVGTLKSNVASLTTDDTNAKQAITTLQNLVGCLQKPEGGYKPLPVTQYGTASGEGYVYATGNGANLFLHTALDVTASGQTPQLWLALVNPSCVKSSTGTTAARKLERLGP
jgi:hypothetical protein